MTAENESKPNLWQQIPTSTKIGFVEILTGVAGEMAAVVKYAHEAIYVNLANTVGLNHEISLGMSSGTRNLAIGSAAVLAAGTVPFFKGIREGLDQQSQ
ncbi:MAG TPA: hypothetical protein VLF39_00430 [Candidatus Saccharimonadales bacterium]|nr:hypothetical protein [Candidatus Saccharimonadales bacterium]